jgi:class 3 adenylate cyclase
MSVLFSDIRSFTTIVEGMTPQQNFAFINSYLAHMEPPIRAENGFIDSYIGDAIMALFAGGADAAVRAGIGDLRALEVYNRERSAAGFKPVRIGVGVSTGQLMLGTIGGRDRINCGVIGDCVNLAARVESMTKMYGAAFLISELTHARLADPSVYELRVVDRVRAKGKTKPVTIYEVLDGLPVDVREKRHTTRARFHEALHAFQEGKDPKQALACFRDVVAADPGDEAAKLWVDRCEHLAEVGLPDDFDGVVELLTK